MKLSIIIPTYNEAKNIVLLIPQIEKTVFTKYSGEMIVVDDNSPDGTAAVARKLNTQYHNIRVIVRKKKEGIGAALKEGYDAANGEIILSTDGDLSFEAEQMLQLVAKLNEGYDLVVGSKYHPEGGFERVYFKSKMNKINRTISRYGNKLVRLVSGIQLYDTSTNFRAIKRQVWESIEATSTSNSFLLEMILKTAYNGFTVAEMPVILKARKYGESKVSVIKEAPTYFMKLLWYVFLYRVLRYNLHR